MCNQKIKAKPQNVQKEYQGLYTAMSNQKVKAKHQKKKKRRLRRIY